jgi:hypothetical protein
MRRADGSAVGPAGGVGAHERDHFKVSIGPGVYPPLELRAEDSGVAGAPIVYQSAR